MRSYQLLQILLAASSYAARPWLDEPDTGKLLQYGNLTVGGELPDIEDIIGLPDFDYVARYYLNNTAYTYYRNGAAGEWSYRNNLEVFHRLRFRPRVMVDIDNIESTLPTQILGFNFSAPFFIAPAARAGFAHPEGEKSIIRGAAAGDVLYIPSDLSTVSKAEIQEARAEGQVMFQQLYIDPNNDTQTRAEMKAAEDNGFNALVLTVDSPAFGNRHGANRFGVGSATDLPIVPKGSMCWEDAVRATEVGVPAIYLTNHGARQLDGTPSPLEIALEIYENAPWVFDHTEVWADGGIRYGSNALKLFALGVKVVGLARPFMYAHIYGEQGILRAINILKQELAIDAGNLGVADLKQINSSYVDLKNNNLRDWGMR
ncbi:Putative FMN-dependent dehydrogenase, alpha-hydroxy acid dehydrogenase, FMN-dependent [Septoria linicola]|uniref:FMN-dependent dehydrogenase, alpha-hydroxy acid dehydrogenase, FMN-dependent n=1 Tax=Septoria linicola TaxID=215465 RepID=A0A9Q9AP53_9PEZI|nr:putative FMN-dependent dehydrogenase, alpha-hydroxy acid dehydrogenase, FMN-dependent [Septoria linicola]USW52879.1 Putative FMN-dependent dehydrogenase, alpha-hydroxy acid dehydrogenase, FMN-dependent [Septoria linicola]